MMYKIGRNEFGGYGQLLEKCAREYILNSLREKALVSFQEWVDEIIVISSNVQKHINPYHVAFENYKSFEDKAGEVIKKEVGKVIKINNFEFYGSFYTKYIDVDLDEIAVEKYFEIEDIKDSRWVIEVKEDRNKKLEIVKKSCPEEQVCKSDDYWYITNYSKVERLDEYIKIFKEENREFLTDKEYEEHFYYKYTYEYDYLVTDEKIEEFLNKNWNEEISKNVYKR